MQNYPDTDRQLPRPDREGPATRMAFYVGGGGLFVAMATDAIAVLGRHAGFALLGSIEIVQACIVLIASSSMIFATLKGTHAAVHILTEHLPPTVAERLAKIALTLSILLFVALGFGCTWIAFELWNTGERTEVLHIPLKPLRLIQIAALLFVATLFLRAILRRSAK
jgi:TRAP-type C4-dicarboxylate transport system permease small subunit